VNDKDVLCETAGCGRVAHCECRWGSEKSAAQTHSFCDYCAEELWSRLVGLVTCGVVWFRIGPVGSMTAEETLPPVLQTPVVGTVPTTFYNDGPHEPLLFRDDDAS